MSQALTFRYEIDGDDFTRAGEASSSMKNKLKQLGLDSDVIDEGPGIPDVEKAMQEGYSTARAEVRSLGFGAGMGLPNMKKYTDEMQIDTTVGKGTTITMKVYI